MQLTVFNCATLEEAKKWMKEQKFEAHFNLGCGNKKEHLSQMLFFINPGCFYAPNRELFFSFLRPFYRDRLFIDAIISGVG